MTHLETVTQIEGPSTRDFLVSNDFWLVFMAPKTSGEHLMCPSCGQVFSCCRIASKLHFKRFQKAAARGSRDIAAKTLIFHGFWWDWKSWEVTWIRCGFFWGPGEIHQTSPNNVGRKNWRPLEAWTNSYP